MPNEVFILILLGLILWTPLAYWVVFGFARIRISGDLLRLFRFDIEAERDGQAAPDSKDPSRASGRAATVADQTAHNNARATGDGCSLMPQRMAESEDGLLNLDDQPRLSS